MRNISTIFKREFLAYFNSPIAYVVAIVFLLVNSGLWLFMSNFFLMRMAEMRLFFGILPITLAVFMPAVTMRMWAEERRTGTIGLLLSLPARNHELVLGKFLASLLFYLVMLAGTVTIPLMIALAGDPDFGPILGGYIGSIFLGAFFLSVGLFVSVLFKDQILALIVSIVLCLGFYLLGTDLVAMPLDGWTGGLGTAIKEAVGVAWRLQSVERGVLGLGDVIHFVSFTAGFVLLNVYAIESRVRMRGASLFPAGVALVLAIAIAVSVAASEMSLPRFDMTEGGVYSLAAPTRRVLAGLKAPVKVHYYVTPRDRMPTYMNMKNLERDVRDKLEEFVEYSHSLTYEIIDPTVDVETQNKLQARNIVPFTAQSVQRDSREARLIYSAISISYLDKKEEILPRVIPQTLGQLEYELISRIYRMTLEDKPTVAIYAPLQYRDPNMRDETYRKMMAMRGIPVPPPEDRFSLVKRLLSGEGYHVVPVKLEGAAKIPARARTLLVLEPEELKPEQVREIEKFVAGGKNLFLALQKHTFRYMAAPRGGWSVIPTRVNSGMEPFLRKFGLSVADSILMDKNSQMVQMNRRAGQWVFREPVSCPVQIEVIPENMNKETGITDRLSGLAYFWGGALTIDEKALEKAGLKAKRLFTTSAGAWSLAGKTTPLMPQDIDPALHKKKGRRLLAVYLEGQAPGGRDKNTTTEVIVVGCAEMFSDDLLRGLSNATFLLNSVDALTLKENLSSVRTKGSVVRMIGDLTDGQKLFYRFLVLGLVPIILVALGITRSIIRKRRRAAYLKKFSQ